jgi:general secretion pathway protein K
MKSISSRRKHERRDQNASVLVLVLIVLTTVTILAAGMAYRTTIEIKLAGAYARRAQAYYLALGGIERALALVSSLENSPSATAAAATFSSSAQDEQILEQLTDTQWLEEHSLSYGIRDEQSCVNVNNSDPAWWEKLPGLDKDCVACMIDWLDEDHDTSPGGAESDFYQSLDEPYTAKNSHIIALKELAYVKNLHGASYRGEDLNRNRLLDENEQDGLKQPPPDNQDRNLDLGLVGLFTVCGNGKVNINTSPKMVWMALPGLDEQAADAISAWRCGPDGQLGTDDDACVTDANELADLEQLTERQVELLQQYCCFESEYLRVFSQAKVAQDFYCCLMATVKISGPQPQIVYLERLL